MGYMHARRSLEYFHNRNCTRSTHTNIEAITDEIRTLQIVLDCEGMTNHFFTDLIRRRVRGLYTAIIGGSIYDVNGAVHRASISLRVYRLRIYSIPICERCLFENTCPIRDFKVLQR